MKEISKLFFKNFKKWYVLLIIALFIGSIIFYLRDFSIIKRIEANTLDFRFNKFPLSNEADTNIVLIAIDNNSLEFAQRNQVFWPWPREFYSFVTRYLADEESNAVLYDIQFYEPDYDRATLDSYTSDATFAEAIGYHGHVILGVQYGEDKKNMKHVENRFSIPVEMSKNLNYRHKLSGALFPIPMFLDQTSALGGINIQPDEDGVIRHVPLFYEINQKYYPQMSFSCFLKSLPTDKKNILVNEKRVKVGNLTIPLNEQMEFPINWYGKGGVDGVFKYIPFSALIQSASAAQFGGNPVLPKGFFKNKYVIIGTTANGLMDLKTSPYTKVMPGMEIWATILSNLLNKHFITYMNDFILWISICVLSFLILIIFTHLSPVKANLSILLILIFTLFIITFTWKYRFYIHFVAPLTTIVVSYITIVLISYILEGRSKREIRKIFTRYLHPDIIESLIKNPDLIEMGGEEIEATVIFSDIYNFTTYSEGKHPKELVKDLNEYFNSITNSILDHNGLLDKYTGDGLMAVFGAPIPRKDHAVLACSAALIHKKFALGIAEKNKKPSTYFHLNTRLGINSGILVAGNIGSEKRMDYTAIGDPVNLAARLEGVNKIFKTQIIISETTWNDVKDRFICRELDFLRVKGKNEPTRIYELVDEMTDENLSGYPWIKEYENALEVYRQGDFVKARILFKTLYEGDYQDNPSFTMMERCEYLISNPPKEWDGILTLNVK